MFVFEKMSIYIQRLRWWNNYDESNPIYLGVKNKGDFFWFKIIFDFYIKMNKVPRKEDFELAFKDKHFNTISKQCQDMIKEHYNKFYTK